MADASSASVFRDVAIVGGGCYGTFYAGQLLRARARGKARYHRLLVVDRDAGCRFARELGPGPGRELVVAEWAGFFDDWLARPRGEPGGTGDVIVPSPLMPHPSHQGRTRCEARAPQARVQLPRSAR